MDPKDFENLLSNYAVRLPDDYISEAWSNTYRQQSEGSENTQNGINSTIQEGKSGNANELNDKKEFYSYLRCLLSNALGEQEGSELCASFYSGLEKRLRVANLEDFDKLASFVSEYYHSL